MITSSIRRVTDVNMFYHTSGTAQSLLKQEYKDDISVEEAVGIVLRVMSKTMDSTTLGSEKCKLYSCSLCV
jgi:20S proteasome subunit alpha 3